MAIEGIGIIGANRKSADVAFLFVENGFQVRVYDSFKESLTILFAKIKWRLEKANKSELLSNIEVIQDYSKFRGADLVIDLSFKTFEERFLYFSKILKEVDSNCIMAISSTSTLLNNFERIPHLPPERTIGVKFPDIFTNSVIEIVKTDYTDLNVVESFIKFCDSLSIKNVVLNDIPGGLIERFFRVYINSAFDALYKGKGFPSFIDSSIKSFTNAKFGPFELLDLRSIDLDYNIAITLTDLTGKNYLRPHEIEHKLFQYGQLGKKTGCGVYLYEDGEIVGENPLLPSIIQYLGLRTVTPQEIFSDIMIPLFDEVMNIAKELMVGQQEIENITKGVFGWDHGIFSYKKIYPEFFIKREKTEFDNLDTF
ncbi:MAG: 3-hydroxyacyl-CoA dehydrogenase family protein [Elusimicrobiales bacterium]|nr:3-hydroxyacyl-CoA dehydrogenase family protein [Elusimicrobiales bacterium]